MTEQQHPNEEQRDESREDLETPSADAAPVGEVVGAADADRGAGAGPVNDPLAALAADAVEGPGKPDAESERAGESDPHDVLAAMAEGRHPEPDDGADEPAPEGDEPVEKAHEELMASTASESVDPAALEGLPAAGDSLAARRARAATFQGQAHRASTHQLKQIMIPLLVAVGALLIVLAGVVMGMLASGRSPKSGAGAWAAVIVAFPLGGFLLFGAWWFRRDVKTAKGANRNSPNRTARANEGTP